MDRKQKIYWFIRREVMWFIIGVGFSGLLSYDFHLGDWMAKYHWPITVAILVCLLVMVYLERPAKQR